MSSTPQTRSDSTNKGGDCNPGAIDDLTCSARGIHRQAEVTEEHLPQLKDFKEKFDSARAEYTKARDAAGKDRDAARTTLHTVREQIRCRVHKDQKQCLARAVDEVFDDIKDCAGDWGCCVDECACEFDDEVEEDDTVATLSARIARYTTEVEKAADCFTRLHKELEDLPERATKIKTEAAQLLADASDPDAGKDVVRLYARLLILERRIEEVWRGFTTVEAYVGCLCKALLCVLRGRQAIAKLEGAKAVLMCKEEAKKAACERKQTQTLEEVMAVYDRLCPPCPPKGAAEAEQDDAVEVEAVSGALT